MTRKSISTLITPGVEYFNSREAYEQVIGKGEQPPPFRDDLPPKFWRTVGEDDMIYQTFNFATGKFDTVTTTEATHLNLPGRYDYPVFKPAPAQVYVTNRGGEKQYVQPRDIIHPAEADRLVMELVTEGFDAALIEATYWAGRKIYYPLGEERRKFYIQIAGVYHGAGLLWSDRQRHVGKPGRWVRLQHGPDWQESTPIITNDLPTVPVPYRRPEEDERIVPAWGIGWAVEVGKAEPGGGEGDHAQVLANQQEILDGVNMLISIQVEGDSR